MPGSTSAPPTTGWAPSPLLISPSRSYVSAIFPWVGLSCHHAGEYQCSPHNGVGSLAIADLSVTVLCTSKYNIQYQCSAHKGMWSLAMADLSLTVLCKYNIHLRVGVSRHHSGEYQCSIHKRGGSFAIADLSLTVLCKYNRYSPGVDISRHHAKEYHCSARNRWAPSLLLISPSRSYVITIFTWAGSIPPPMPGSTSALYLRVMN